jgi:undecaprenyl-diphosphatase
LPVAGWRLGVVCAVLGLVTVLTTADVLADGVLRRWDRDLKLGNDGLGLTSGPWFRVWRTIVWAGQYWLVALICAVAAAAVALRLRKPWLLVGVGVWLVADQGAVWVFKKLVGRTFPGSGRDALFTRGEAFPSGHSALGASCLLVLAVLLPLLLRAIDVPPTGVVPRVTAWLSGPGVEGRAARVSGRFGVPFAVLLAVLVATATVLLGYHWPTDAMAGWSFGLLSGVVGCEVVRRTALV